MLSCAVIGCGAAGMVASTTLRRSGLLVTCFELAADPGGVWNSDTRSPFSSRGLVSPVHPTMRCVLPKDLLSFSDQRFDYSVPQFPHHSSVRRYLEQYAEQKGVRGLVRFNTKVQSVRYDERSAVWRIITVNIVNGDVFEWSFDKVCVCTGQTHEPRYPDGIKELLAPYLIDGGELHHASHVKDFRQFRGKRVVVVGDGVTACDYCLELRRCGADVHHSHSAADRVLLWDETVGQPSVRMSRGGAMRDAVGAVLQFLSRTPGWRTDATKGSRIVSSWLRLRNGALWGEVPGVGHPITCEGRGILFADPHVRTTDVIDEAKARFLAREGHSSNKNSGGSGTFIDNVDAVICATGYTTRYPFLNREMRDVLEAPPLLLPQHQQQRPQQKQRQLNQCEDSATTALYHRGLYLGTLYAHNPSIAFVGMQKELLPPFMLFEAQSKFIAYAFTQRLKLPTDVVGLLARQSDLMMRYPLLVNLCSPHGLGLYSAVYYNTLQEELQVGSRNTYTANIMERQKWLLLTSLLRLLHKTRSMAPLKRKKQHVLFSNAV
ncbi:dimethylaniline monooxygenase (N-oxide forming) [Trypanosoma grayi]|uniref:dimethylaniline monooxygenase (N-oxide forming) n=1 Tax=Trypanosoma grayi TaxID=71804 RepID=UPI0004F4543F|nr:dimethylaniline monooxygenase (N-oxide forming) [Trypanosoma grayi]KEG13928.1 dimethylaniline monooxygenase (N-oxide forming) [Trypanosoma grayi]